MPKVTRQSSIILDGETISHVFFQCFENVLQNELAPKTKALSLFFTAIVWFRNFAKNTSKGWLAFAKLKPHSLFISLLSMLKKAFYNVKKWKVKVVSALQWWWRYKTRVGLASRPRFLSKGSGQSICSDITKTAHIILTWTSNCNFVYFFCRKNY